MPSRRSAAHLSDDDDLAAQMRGLVHNSLFEGPDLFREVRTITVSESLRGKLAELILPKTVEFQSGIPPRLSTASGPAFVPESGLEAVGYVGGYTGVIVDARGLKITPCLLPVIYGQDGLGAYGAFLVSRADAVSVGVAAYANTAAPEALVSRVGKRPLVVKGLACLWRLGNRPCHLHAGGRTGQGGDAAREGHEGRGGHRYRYAVRTRKERCRGRCFRCVEFTPCLSCWAAVCILLLPVFALAGKVEVYTVRGEEMSPMELRKQALADGFARAVAEEAQVMLGGSLDNNRLEAMRLYFVDHSKTFIQGYNIPVFRGRGRRPDEDPGRTHQPEDTP